MTKETLLANQDPLLPLQEPLSGMHTLLYVEDNSANLLLVKRLISRSQNLKLLTAISSDMGVLLARIYQPNVILMDIHLPGMSGLDALKILRNDPITAHIPVVALSSNAFQNSIIEGVAAGFFRYLTKPFVLKELTDMLDMALRHAQVSANLL